MVDRDKGTADLINATLNARDAIAGVIERFLGFARQRFTQDATLAAAAVAEYPNVYYGIRDRIIRDHLTNAATEHRWRHALDCCIDAELFGEDSENQLDVDGALYIIARACIGAHEHATRLEFKLDGLCDLDMMLVQRVLLADPSGCDLSFCTTDKKTVTRVSPQHRWNDGETIKVVIQIHS